MRGIEKHRKSKQITSFRGNMHNGKKKKDNKNRFCKQRHERRPVLRLNKKLDRQQKIQHFILCHFQALGWNHGYNFLYLQISKWHQDLICITFNMLNMTMLFPSKRDSVRTLGFVPRGLLRGQGTKPREVVQFNKATIFLKPCFQHQVKK